MVSSTSSTSTVDNMTPSVTSSSTAPTKKKRIRSSFRKLLSVRKASFSSSTENRKIVAEEVGSAKTVVTCFAEEDDYTSRQSSFEFDLDDEQHISPDDAVSIQEESSQKLPQDGTIKDAHVLFLQGRSHSLNQRWDEALECQQQALCRSDKLQKVRIEYEISKIELAKYNDPCEAGYSLTRCRLHQSAVKYYEVELLRKRQSKSQDSSRDVLSILHTLGRLYDEKLNDFENALRCYNEALAMESLLYNEEQEFMLQKTRRKIGSLLHKTGDFQLAIVTSFNI